MKLRARRIALLTVVAGCLVVAGLAAFHWPTMRDHTEAWWFVAMRETKTVRPEPTRLLKEHEIPPPDWQYQELADVSGQIVVFDPTVDCGDHLLIAEISLGTFRERGFRIIEQRFPRRAYVVVGYPEGKVYFFHGKPKRHLRRPLPQVEVEARFVERS